MDDKIKELLYHALETEIGGQAVYKAAIKCAVMPDLKEEWQKYLEETETHEQILIEVFGKLKLDPALETPGRKVVRFKGQSLVQAMEHALASGPPPAAQLCAAESVVEAETKDHQNWEVIGSLAKTLSGTESKTLQAAYERVEEQEDEHLYHTMGWARELWLDFLGMKAQLPPPEEEKEVTSGVEAAKTQEQRLRAAGRKRSAALAAPPKAAAKSPAPKSPAPTKPARPRS